MRSNLTNLVRDAMAHGEATASGGKWRAYRDFPTLNPRNPYGGHERAVEVWHHATPMFRVYAGGSVVPVNPGHGSTSDRCGVRRITEGAGVGVGHRELFDGVVAS